MTDRSKIRYWWSEDRKWFCVLTDDGVNQSTVSLTPEEASHLAALANAETGPSESGDGVRLPHLARQFYLMARGCRSRGLTSWEDHFSRLYEKARNGTIDRAEIVETIDKDYRSGQDGRSALEIIITALLADADPLASDRVEAVQQEADTYQTLQEANAARQKEWDPDNRITLAYRGNEMAGEVGEACNVIKKLERERLGINGSRDTLEHLGEELADGVICHYLTAMSAGIDLDAAIEQKFNATSEKMNLKTRLRLYAAPVHPRNDAETIERETIERCAKVAEAFGEDYGLKYIVNGDEIIFGTIANTADDIASAIRALMPLPNGNGG